MKNPREVLVELSLHFQKDLKRLSKKYRNVQDDVQPILESLRGGNVLGDQVMGVGKPVYKVRVPNSDARRGSAGGYRVIYYLRTAERLTLITIYSKSEQADVSAKQIRAIIDEFELPRK
jgi:mRNA-degrading endonuclease RelE of RelBE toxin-antitoxin system